jgi:anti-sigma factor RsiW
MVAPSAQVRRIGHGTLVTTRFVAASPDLDAVLDAPTRSWPVRVVISWPTRASQTVEVIDVAAVGANAQASPGAPRWGLELAGPSAAPLHVFTGPGAPASIFCMLWPWASFCH